MADTNPLGLEERPSQPAYAGAQCKAAGRDRSALPSYPPGPADLDGWRRVLEVRPDLAPALESPLRGKPDVITGWMDRAMSNRTKRLKALGNGVFVDAAEWIGRRILEATQ